MRVNFCKLASYSCVASLLSIPSFGLVIHDEHHTSQLHALGSTGGFKSDFGNATNGISDVLTLATIALKENAGLWVAPLTVGTQVFNVLHDTGSNGIVVPLGGDGANACQNCLNLNKYDPSKNSAGKGTGKTTTFTYATGKATGEIYDDNIAIAGLPPLPAFPFLAAATLSQDLVSSKIDGVFGLGVSPSADNPNIPVYIPALLSQNPSSQKKFSYLPTASGATLAIGGDLPSASLDKLVQLKVANGPNWTVALNSIKAQGANGATTDNGASSEAVVAIDTGSNVIVGPEEQIADFYDYIKETLGLAYTQKVQNGLNIYTLPCNMIPNLLVEFYDAKGTTFSIPSANLRSNVVGQNCETKLVGGNLGTWILGTPFLKTVYSQFNIGEVPDKIDSEEVPVSGFSVGFAPLP